MIVQGGWSKSGFRYCSLRALSSTPQLVTENVVARYGEVSWECGGKKRLLSFIGKRTRGTSQAGKRPDASWQDLGQWSGPRTEFSLFLFRVNPINLPAPSKKKFGLCFNVYPCVFCTITFITDRRELPF